MITIKRAADLQVGDVFSTDGYVVRSALALNDYTNRISVELWLDASGGVVKRALLDADESCPIWTADDVEAEAVIDRRVQRRLATDAAYRNAENADEQSQREDEITQQEEERFYAGQ